MTGGGGPRPRRLVVITGTGTEIGKTWVGCALIRALRSRGLTVSPRKPAQSHDRGDDPSTLDAALLAAAAGCPPDEVCPPGRTYPVPMAPPMAAEALGLPPFDVADLVTWVAGSWSGGQRGVGAPVSRPDEAVADVGLVEGAGGVVADLGLVEGAGGVGADIGLVEGAGGVGADLGLVEGAGGVAAPQAADGDMVAVIDALEPDLVVLVAPPGLGTINLVRLSTAALRPHPVVVHLNPWPGPDGGLAQANRAWLAERDGLAVTTAIDDLALLVAGVAGVAGRRGR